MKIDLKKLAAKALKVAGPIAAALVVQKLTTGKADVKGVILDAAETALSGLQAQVDTHASTIAALTSQISGLKAEVDGVASRAIGIGRP